MSINNLERNLTLWFGIVVAVLVYYTVHEGTHFIQAVISNNFNSIRLVGFLGIEIVTNEVPTGIELALFSGLSAVVTSFLGYIMVLYTPKILMLKRKIIKVSFYYITIILLILDPVYLSVLHRFVGGGDMNGITIGLGLSSLPISILFGILAVVNLYIIIKKVHPVYKEDFN